MAAAPGKLFIVTGGLRDAVDACMPLFEEMGQKAIHAGDAPPTACQFDGRAIVTAQLSG